MRRLAAALLLAVAACGSPSPPSETPQDSPWTKGADLPTPRTEVAIAALDGRIYAVGGFTRDGKATEGVEVYDVATDRWHTPAPLPEPLHHAGVAAAGGRIFVVGGYRADGSASAKVWSRTPADDSWRAEPDLPTPRGALAVAAFQAGAGAIVHAVGGASSFGGTTSLSGAHEVFDSTTRRWTSQPALPDPRDHLSAAVVGSTLYVAGGRKLSLTTNSARLDVYDLETDRWSRGADMPTARGGLAAAAGVQKVYVVGGEEPDGTFEEVEVYDETTGKWSAAPDLPTPRHGLGAVAIDGTLYVIGGGPTPGLSVSGANEILRNA